MASPTGGSLHCGFTRATWPYSVPKGPSSDARRSGRGVGTRPSTVAVTRFARRASRICRAGRQGHPHGKQVGHTSAWLLGWPGPCPKIGPQGTSSFPQMHWTSLLMALEAPPPERITQRICEAIKGQIASGQLGPGARLPSTRALAAEWGVSRTTVTAAYEQLMAEGYLETRHGARSQVAQGLGRTSTQ